jgi:HSP20 family protein
MEKKKNEKGIGLGNLEGILGGISDILGKLGNLAEKGESLKRTGDFKFESGDKDIKGVYGFSIKTGLGGEGVSVEPFGNIKQDEKSGQPIVEEFREPVVDFFEEEDHVLIVAEMPGVGVDDVRLDLKDDLLGVVAEKGMKKYRKEILLPWSCSKDKIRMVSNNGLLEIRCEK